MEGGADPLVRAGPPGPPFPLMNQADGYNHLADGGVGRGPGGPPHGKNCVALGFSPPSPNGPPPPCAILIGYKDGEKREKEYLL